MLQVLQPLPLFFVSLFEETSWSLFSDGTFFLNERKLYSNAEKASYSLARAPPHLR